MRYGLEQCHQEEGIRLCGIPLMIFTRNDVLEGEVLPPPPPQLNSLLTVGSEQGEMGDEEDDEKPSNALNRSEDRRPRGRLRASNALNTSRKDGQPGG